MVKEPISSKKTAKGTPDSRPLCNHAGDISLPAESFRGVLRSQAEKIIRTLGGKACRIDDPEDACKALEDIKDKGRLCMACQVFGASGWQTPVHLTDFENKAVAVKTITQEFVAIDRFTGGGADERKFNAEAVVEPSLAGKMSVDLKRVEPWALGLIVLVMRDLVEGDLAFGARAAKDYGACKATVVKESLRVQGAHSALVKLITAAGLTIEAADNWDKVKVKTLLNTFVVAFRERVKKKMEAGNDIRPKDA